MNWLLSRTFEMARSISSLMLWYWAFRSARGIMSPSPWRRLLDRECVGWRADAARNVERCRSQEELVALVGGAIGGKLLEVPHLSDWHPEQAEQMEMQKVLIVRRLRQRLQRG